MNIPGYRIEQEIGRGGMATVYRAVQESLQRTVAVKVMSAALAAEAGFGERFLREARTAANLSHPGILSIHDVGVVGHNYYLAMEYIPGGDLKQRIKKGIPPEEVLAIVKQIANALGHAHNKGFVHRDVKPENILFREDGSPVLADFGIAKALGSGTRMTGTGMSIGTPHYMSPEQVRGKDVDGRSDLYSLGILLYEALTGKLPYDGEDAFSIGIAHINDPLPQLPDTLARIQPLIEKLMAKKQGQRYPSSLHLLEDITMVLNTAQSGSGSQGQLVTHIANASSSPVVRHKVSTVCSDDFYEQALTEYQQGGYNKPAYAKAVVETEGNEKLLLAAYIRLRTRQLEEERDKSIRERKKHLELEKAKEIKEEALKKNRELTVSEYKIFSIWKHNESLAISLLCKNNPMIKKDFETYSNSPEILKRALSNEAENYTHFEVLNKIRGKNFYPGELFSLILECFSRKLYLGDLLNNCHLYCSSCKRALSEADEIIVCTSCGTMDYVGVK